jgi:hypothetical protein
MIWNRTKSYNTYVEENCCRIDRDDCRSRKDSQTIRFFSDPKRLRTCITYYFIIVLHRSRRTYTIIAYALPRSPKFMCTSSVRDVSRSLLASTFVKSSRKKRSRDDHPISPFRRQLVVSATGCNPINRAIWCTCNNNTPPAKWPGTAVRNIS